MKKNLLSGTFWLSSANLLCKVLGIIYLIPWLMMMGSKDAEVRAQALYNVAYLPYALFLTLGTAGFPSGIAKKIAAEKENPQNVQLLFKSSLGIMEGIGVISAILMFIFAPLLSQISPVSNLQEATWAIRSLCPSLMVIPILSALRGYFQGVSDVIPYSLSNVIEQLVRVIVILAGTFYLRVLTDGSILSAVVISTLASCFGGLVSIAYLMFVGKRKDYFRLRFFVFRPSTLLQEQRPLVISVIRESLPFIYVASAISIAQLIDQVTLKGILYYLTHQLSLGQTEVLFTQAAANPNKLTAVLITIIGSISVTSLPLLTSLRSQKDLLVGISDVLRLALTFLLPATIGMFILAQPMYTILFGYDPATTGYMRLAIVTTAVLSISSILLAIMQAIGMHRAAITLVTKALAIKLLLQFPLVWLTRGYGLNLATGAAFLVITLQGYRKICSHYEIQPLHYVRNYVKQLIFAAGVMTLLCGVAYLLLAQLIQVDTRMGALLISVLIAGLGSGIYVLAGLPRQVQKVKNRLLSHL
ncbi:polysaccharide biosynthesis protein [Enterococcus sp. 669A]|uniref:Polysaccharide biosynthesis protein n=1 Tax=Candidatus Enterococcus moelleringii TaxID=2815325 RepID=A0ABS3LDP2_9ENTE|nr:polysaccharide biosynthesis protein [Enterococcus sp. 669A]MBO1307747.1 polysaccharide biosynthesis protein [Enterococcus sp. 669A]